MKEGLEFEFTADMSDFNNKMEKARDDIEGFKKRIESEEAINLSINIATLLKQIQLAKAKLKQAQDNGDLEAEIQITGNIERLKQAKTQALRELRNFTRTGEKDVSVLGNLFESVTKEINKSREALGSLGSKLTGLDRIEKNVAEVNQQFKEGKITIEQYQMSLEKLKGQATASGKTFGSLNETFMGFGKTLVGLYGLNEIKNQLLQASQTAVSMETAFVGVRKTMDGSEQDFQKIEEGLRRMSLQIPLTVEELAGIAEVGGQLGVAKEDILDFTEVTAMLGATTVLTSEQAATSMARISQILQEPIANLSFMGSALVDLGNKFNANEAEILDFSERIAGAGAIVGLTSAQVMGISTAFASVGIEAEAGGTAVQKTLLTINRAVNQNGVELQKFALVAGLNAKEFARTWKEDAGAGFLQFVNGLSKSGQEADQILADLIGEDVRLARAFLSVANAGDLLNQTMEIGNQAYTEGTALAEEFEKRLASNASQLQIQRNEWRLLQEELGQKVTPILIWLNDFFLTTLPGAIGLASWSVSYFASKMNVASLMVQKFLTILAGGISLAMAYVVDQFQSLGNNAQIVAHNVGEAFKSIPNFIEGSLNLAIKGIEAFLNAPMLGINLLLTALRKIPGVAEKIPASLGKISLGSISIPGSTANFKSLEKAKEFNRQAVADGVNAELEAYDRKMKIEDDALAMTAQRIQKEYMDRTDKQKKATDQQKKELKKQMDNEIAIAKGILDKLADLEDDGKGGKGKGGGTAGSKDKKKEALEKAYQEQVKKTMELLKDKAKINSETYNQIIKDMDKAIDGLGKYVDGIIKAKEEIKKFKEEAKSSLRDVNNDLNELNKDEGKQLGERRVSILEDQKKLMDDIAKKEKEGVSLATAQSISKKALLGATDTETFVGGKTASDYLEILDLEEKRLKLQQELDLINKNASADTLQQVENYSKLSDAEKILYDTEQKRKDILEKKSIYEKALNGENIDLSTIKNYDNLKTAEELVAKKTEMDTQLQIQEAGLTAQKELLITYNQELKTMKAEELEEYKKIIQGKKDIEEEFTKYMADELRKRIQEEANIKGQAGEVAGKVKTANQTSTTPTTTIGSVEIKVEGTVRSEADVQKIADKVYSKLESETRMANKNIY